MVIAHMEPDKKPRVEEYKGEVAIWAGKGGDDAHGLLLSANSAIDTALGMLGVAGKLTDDVLSVDGSTISLEEAAEPADDIVARLMFEIHGARFAFVLTATALCEVASASKSMADRLA